MKLKFKLIGLYELISGIFGFILLAFKVLSNINSLFSSISIFFSFVLGLLLFAGLTYSGYALLNDLKNGVKYSVWAQALQAIAFTTGGIQYLFAGAAFFYIHIQNGIAVKTQLSVIDYGIYRLEDTSLTSLSIYILPLFFILLLSSKKSFL